ncbi:PP2C family protein-serine/threonine phosphatase [Megalodesulfovibrio paquesii]
MDERPQFVVRHHGITDIGNRRSRNEDCFLVDEALGLYLVADGMGGHQAGEVAATLTAQTMHRCIQAAFAPEGPPPEAMLWPRDPSLSEQANLVRAAILEANQAVKAKALESETTQGMGSTVAAVFLHRNVLVAANVGDSIIYLLRDDVMRELSVLHTVAAEQTALARALPPQMRSRLAHMLTRAVGTRDEVVPDFFETIPRPGDILLLCTDGLTDKVSPEELQPLLQSLSPQDACSAFLALALERGGEDNITSLVLHLQTA